MLNPITVGDAIASFVSSSAPAPGTPVSPAQLQTLWEGIMTIIYNDLKANMQVLPGTFNVALAPVTGIGGPAQ